MKNKKPHRNGSKNEPPPVGKHTGAILLRYLGEMECTYTSGSAPTIDYDGSADYPIASGKRVVFHPHGEEEKGGPVRSTVSSIQGASLTLRRAGDK